MNTGRQGLSGPQTAHAGIPGVADSAPRVVFYAPNVHTGGGDVLLRALLQAWPAQRCMSLFLDERARSRLALEGRNVQWVQPRIASRWRAEQQLSRICQDTDVVLCFHGLPPMLPNRGRVVVFQQNRLYLGLSPLRRFSARTAVRLGLERLAGRLFRHRAAEYIVQTPTMAWELARWYGDGPGGRAPVIRVLPFAGTPPEAAVHRTGAAEWDFVYVSDGEAHKNHRRLLEAWQELAEQGFKPRLAVTLGERDAVLAAEVAAVRARTGIEVHNLGQIPHEEVLALYGRSRALIFPSLAESFGLPLIEARQMSLPVLAPELDYVRDVCEPVQTFDPNSAHSIASAVRRFLGQPVPPVSPHAAADFWRDLLATQRRA